MRNLIFLTIFFFTIISKAQQITIKGQIIDSENNGIAYVNIGIFQKNIGSVSNIDGHFSLNISKSNLKDSLSISVLGYFSQKIPIGQFVKNNYTLTVLLKEKQYLLNEVCIKPKNYKTIRKGNYFNNPNRLCGLANNMLGFEIGVLMENNKLVTIKEIGFNVAEFLYDTLLIRINIYEAKNGEIGLPLLKEPTYYSVSKTNLFEKNNGTAIVDIFNHQVQTDSDFFVSIEFVVDYPKENGFLLCDGIFSFSKTYTRATSFGVWEKAPFNASINSKVCYEK